MGSGFPRVEALNERLQDGCGYERGGARPRERRIVWAGATQGVTGCRGKELLGFPVLLGP